jgi:DNA-directed RNA polymerase subunit K/omega
MSVLMLQLGRYRRIILTVKRVKPISMKNQVLNRIKHDEKI